MSTVVVIVHATSFLTVSPTSTGPPSTSSSNLSTGTIAGIAIGILFGGILLIGLTFFLLSRCDRHKFTKVAHGDAERAYLSTQGAKRFGRHSQRPSVSSEPLMSPASWPAIPTTSRIVSATRLDSVLPEIRHSIFTLGAFGEITPSNTTIPPAREAPPASLRPGLDDTPQTSDDVATPSTPTKSSQTLFLHRMLKSRAQASENVTLASRSGTLDSSTIHGDEEQLLAEAEQSALRDAEAAQRGEKEIILEGEDDWEEVHSTESMYSQSSAPVDHSGFFSDGVSRQNSGSSMTRRKSSRRRPHTPVPPPELSPVTEVPDTPRGLVGRDVVLTPSIDAQVSVGTTDQPGANFPLLTSTNFGKDGTPSATSGSLSSSAGWGGSGRTSRYPSVATSSLGLSSQCGPRSDDGPDWRHPPSGLAGLTSLQVGSLRNPHSPVEERRGVAEVPTAVKRAHLREGTASSLPEVERRDVVHSGIADIDVAL